MPEEEHQRHLEVSLGLCWIRKCIFYLPEHKSNAVPTTQALENDKFVTAKRCNVVDQSIHDLEAIQLTTSNHSFKLILMFRNLAFTQIIPIIRPLGENTTSQDVHQAASRRETARPCRNHGNDPANQACIIFVRQHYAAQVGCGGGESRQRRYVIFP